MAAYVPLDYKQKFWRMLQNGYRSKIPPHLINILDVMGYANPVSFSRITEESIVEIEEFVKRKLCCAFFIRNDINAQQKYFGPFFRNPSNFMILPGEKELILGLAVRIRKYPELFTNLKVCL